MLDVAQDAGLEPSSPSENVRWSGYFLVISSFEYEDRREYLVCPAFPRLVVIRITPLAARDP